MLSRATRRVAMRASAARALSTSSTPQQQLDLVDRLFRSSKSRRVPLDEPFAASTFVPTASEAPALGPVQVTTLENGLRVATVESGAPVSHVVLAVSAGSRHETAETNGLTALFERLAFQSTTRRSAFRIVREVSANGGNATASASRDVFQLAATSGRDDVAFYTEVIADAVVNHAVNEWEFSDRLAELAATAGEKDVAADHQVMEMVHAAAFHDGPLGLPTLPSADHLRAVASPAALKRHLAGLFVPSRMALSAVGVNHDAFVAIARKQFGALRGTAAPVAPANYVGGEVRSHAAADGQAHVALAFRGPSWGDSELVASTVLRTILGGGSSFSTGGPGKGLYTRLFTDVLNQHHDISVATAFNAIYADAGLIGLYGATVPEDAELLTKVLVQQAKRMAGPVNPEELARAKNRLKALIRDESRALLAEDISRQLITGRQSYKTADEFCAEIDAVTAADVQSVAKASLASPLSLAAYGAIANVPRYETIAKQIA